MSNVTDPGAAGEGYEEYGHVVELGGDEAGKKEKGSEEVRPGPEDADTDDDFITDSVENLSNDEKKDPAVDVKDEAKPKPNFEKFVTVPIELTEDEIKNSVPVKVVFEIKVRS